MAIQHSLTSADVKRIYAENLARGKTPAEARQGTRTEVHELLQKTNDVPYPLPPPARKFAAHETQAKAADLAQRKAAMRAQLTDEEILASERARSGPDGTHRDAHHFVQKQHGIAMWREADRLVNEAGV